MQNMTQNDFLWILTVCGILFTVFREIQFAKVKAEAKSIQLFLRQIITRQKNAERNGQNGFKEIRKDLDRLSERIRDLVQDMRYDRVLDSRSQGPKIYNTYSGHGDSTEVDSVDVHGGQNNIGKTDIGGKQQQDQD